MLAKYVPKKLRRHLPWKWRKPLVVQELMEQLRKLDESWLSRMRKAERAEDSLNLEKQLAEYQFDRSELADRLSEIQDQELVSRAREHHVFPPDIGCAERNWNVRPIIDYGDSETGIEGPPSAWEVGKWGNQWLTSDAEDELRKRLRAADKERRRERREVWSFWVSIFFGVFGTLTGLLGVLASLLSLDPDLLRRLWSAAP